MRTLGASVARRGLRADRLFRGPVLQLQRGYQGNLQDKDRIFTNLYNDDSQFLEGANKRVGAAAVPSPARPWRPPPPRRRAALRTPR